MLSQETNGERREARIRPKKKELHELLYTKIEKSGIIRLTSGEKWEKTTTNQSTYQSNQIITQTYLETKQ